MASKSLIAFLFVLCSSLQVIAQDYLSLYNSAQQQFDEGDYTTAMQTAKKCLQSYQSQDGSLSSNYESILRLLTNIAIADGKFEEGLEYNNKEIDIKESQGNDSGLEYATALLINGDLLRNLNEYDKALEIFLQVEKLYTPFYGSSDAEYIECQWNIANIYYELGSSQESLNIYNNTVPNYNTDNGVGMEYVLAIFNFSNLLIQNNNYAEAFDYVLILEDVYSQFGDDAAYDLALILTNKGLCLNKAKEFSRAEEAYTSADRYFKLINDTESKEYFNMVNLRAINRQEMGDSDGASELLSMIGENAGGTNQIVALNNEGSLLIQNKEYGQARSVFNKALAISNENNDLAEKFETLLNLANLEIEENNLAAAKSLLDEASLLNQDESAKAAKYYYILGRYLDARGNWKQALAAFDKVYQALENDKGNTLYLNVLGAMAVIEQNNGNYIKAEEYFSKQLTFLAEKGLKSSVSYAITLNNLGTNKQNQADYLEAQGHLEEAQIIINQQLGIQSEEYAGVIENLGLALTQLGDYYKAEELINQSLEIRKNMLGENHPSFANALQNLGRIKQFKGKYQEAEPLFTQALNLKKSALGAQHPDYASALNSSALLYQTMGNFEKARPLFEEASSIFKTIYGARHPEYATALENQATLFKLENNNERALELLEEALSIDKEVYGTNHPVYATTLHNLASIYKDIDETAKARNLYMEALAIDEAVYGEKHPAYAGTVYNLAVLNQQLGNYDEAENGFKKALEIRKDILGENHPDYSYSLYGLAGLYHATMRLEAAKPYYDEVITNYLQQIADFFPSLSENEKGAFYAKIKPVIESYQDYCIEYAYGGFADSNRMIGELFNLQLRTKALLLHSSNKVRNRIFSSGDKALIEQYLEWTQAKEKLSKYLAFSESELTEQGVNLQELSNEINDLEKNLSQNSEFFAQEAEEVKYTWQDVKEVLQDNQGAMEIIRVKKRFAKDSVLYVALIVKNTSEESPEMVIIKDGKDLEDRYFNYYRNSIKFTIGDDISYKEFWQPIDVKLEGIEYLFASTDGIYNKVNINTLWDPEMNQFVIDEYNVRNISNTREIVMAQSKTLAQLENSNKAEVFGFPDFNLALEEEIDLTITRTRASEFGFNSEEIPELPGTKVEVDKLNELLNNNAWNANLYLRENASEENLKAINPPKLLHVATHGFFKSDVTFEDDTDFSSGFNNAQNNPLFRSGLLLAGSENTKRASNNFDEEDGVLTAYEAMNLNLDNTELVVLSACETGIGEVRNGEGVYGLQRSFMVAGAKSVIMSLWQVDDNTTQQLMVNFYQNWLSGDNKFEAFKKAQLELKDVYADPFHWGAFIIIGTD